MDKLYIVIPAYNEEENIQKVIDEWYPIVEAHQAEGESRLLVIDDGSKDRTYNILCGMKKRYPLLTAISKQNEGHGATLSYGYQYAIEHGADYIFQTDSDGQTRPEEFHEFWEKRKEYDMVIGYRNKRQDGWTRIFVTKTLKLVIAVCFGVTVKDANTPLLYITGQRFSIKSWSTALCLLQSPACPVNAPIPVCQHKKISTAQTIIIILADIYTLSSSSCFHARSPQ